MYKLSIAILLLLTLFINKSLQITIDLKSQPVNVYDLSTHLNFSLKLATSAQIYSSQLNDNLVNQYFQIETNNNSNLKLSLNRYDMCSNLKYCARSSNSAENKCVLNLNVIYYMKPSLNIKQINQIKSIKLNLVLNDLANSTRLTFDKDNYEFNVNSLTDEIGLVRASMNDDSEMNGLIKYFLEFEDDDRVEFNNLFQIDSNNGSLTLNRQYVTNSNKTYQFYVNAVAQCSLGQKALRNRTLIRVSQVNETYQSQVTFRLKHLIETKTLINSIECVKLKAKDLTSLNQTIALAQIIVENGMNQIQASSLENDIKLFGFQPNNSNFNQLTRENLSIQHLADNIFVVYLVKTKNFDQIFLNDIYKLQLQIGQSVLDIYLCLDHLEANNQFTDSFSLIQFIQNVYHLNPPIYLNSSSHLVDSSSIVLEAYDLSSSNASIQFYLDDNLSSSVFNLSLEQLSSTQTKLTFKNSLLNQDSVIEKMQYELIGIAFDSHMNNDQFNFELDSSDSSSRVSQLKRVVYNDLTRQALNNKKFLRFTCKILINTHADVCVNDSTSVVYDNQANLYKLNVNSDKLVQNSIIGYLPNVYDLNTKYLMSFNTKQIEYFYYSLSSDEATSNTSMDCFRLNKFDGVLKIANKSPKECFANVTLPLKLNVKLNSLLDESINEELTQIWIYDVKSDRNKSSVSLIYNANDLELNSDAKNVIKSASVSVFSMSYLLNVDKDYSHKLEEPLPAYVKLVDLVSYFQANISKADTQFDSKTTFEFIQSDKSLRELFIMDTKQNAIYLNITKSVRDKFIQFKCYNFDLIAKNYIYLNSIKRKLVSFDSFQLNLCFFNNETISYKDFVANRFSFRSLLVPFQNENRLVGLQQYLLMNYSENSNIVLFIFLLASCAIISISLILIATFLKQKKQASRSTPTRRNFANPLMNRYYSSSIDTTTTNSTDVSPTVLLKIRNDLSFNRHQGNFVFQDKNGKFYTVNTSTLNRMKSSISNSNSSSNDLNAYGAPNKMLPLSPTIPEMNSPLSKFDNKSKESSEDQGVYCLATGTSFSMSSNISSVTNSQFVDSDYNNQSSSSSIIVENTSATNTNNVMPLSPIDLTRLSLFDMTPARSNKQNYESKNTYVRELNAATCDQMKNWIIQNYYQNCANTNNLKSKSTSVNIDNVECII